MPLSTIGHWNVIIFSLLAGVILGLLFDFYRIIRGKNVNKVIVVVQDILFWILSALTIFVFLLYNNYGFLGAYVYMFMFLGLLLYLKFASDYMYTIETKSIEGICKIFRIIYKNITYPTRVISLKMKKKQ